MWKKKQKLLALIFAFSCTAEQKPYSGPKAPQSIHKNTLSNLWAIALNNLCGCVHTRLGGSVTLIEISTVGVWCDSTNSHSKKKNSPFSGVNVL